jgi:hypothetical protein
VKEPLLLVLGNRFFTKPIWGFEEVMGEKLRLKEMEIIMQNQAKDNFDNDCFTTSLKAHMHYLFSKVKSRIIRKRILAFKYIYLIKNAVICHVVLRCHLIKWLC